MLHSLSATGSPWISRAEAAAYCMSTRQLDRLRLPRSYAAGPRCPRYHRTDLDSAMRAGQVEPEATTRDLRPSPAARPSRPLLKATLASDRRAWMRGVRAAPGAEQGLRLPRLAHPAQGGRSAPSSASSCAQRLPDLIEGHSPLHEPGSVSVPEVVDVNVSQPRPRARAVPAFLEVAYGCHRAVAT